MKLERPAVKHFYFFHLFHSCFQFTICPTSARTFNSTTFKIWTYFRIAKRQWFSIQSKSFTWITNDIGMQRKSYISGDAHHWKTITISTCTKFCAINDHGSNATNRSTLESNKLGATHSTTIAEIILSGFWTEIVKERKEYSNNKKTLYFLVQVKINNIIWQLILKSHPSLEIMN